MSVKRQREVNFSMPPANLESFAWRLNQMLDALIVPDAFKLGLHSLRIYAINGIIILPCEVEVSTLKNSKRHSR